MICKFFSKKKKKKKSTNQLNGANNKIYGKNWISISRILLDITFRSEIIKKAIYRIIPTTIKR